MSKAYGKQLNAKAISENNSKEPPSKLLDKQWSDIQIKMMKKCLKLAKSAQSNGDVPVGALLVDETGAIISQSGNIREQKNTVLGHAELAVLHQANGKKKSWRLPKSTLYVTLEPCAMCAAAIMQARVTKVIFATHDPKGGCFGSIDDFSKRNFFHHKIEISQGLLAAESSKLLKDFFKKRRLEKKQ